MALSVLVVFSASNWESVEVDVAGRKMYTKSFEVGEDRIVIGLYGKVAITGPRNAAAPSADALFTCAYSCFSRH